MVYVDFLFQRLNFKQGSPVAIIIGYANAENLFLARN